MGMPKFIAVLTGFKMSMCKRVTLRSMCCFYMFQKLINDFHWMPNRRHVALIYHAQTCNGDSTTACLGIIAYAWHMYAEAHAHLYGCLHGKMVWAKHERKNLTKHWVCMHWKTCQAPLYSYAWACKPFTLAHACTYACCMAPEEQVCTIQHTHTPYMQCSMLC